MGDRSLNPDTAPHSWLFYREMVECFSKIAEDAECRAVVISGMGKMFTSGMRVHHPHLPSPLVRKQGSAS